MKRILYCEGCKIKVAVIRDAALKKGMVCLCPGCEVKRKASDLAAKTKPNDLFSDIFGKRGY